MINIFPRAESALIEQTIGHQRPNAHPPENQVPREPNPVKRFAGFRPLRSFPRWFDHDCVSDYERRIFEESDYLRIRNDILDFYSYESGEITLNMCRRFGDFASVIKIFDFLEDNKLINHDVDLKYEINELRSSMMSNYASDNENNLNASDHTDSTIPGTHTPFENNPPDKKTNLKIRKKYITREFLQNALCKCNKNANLFTSDLFFVCDDCFVNLDYPKDYTPRNFHRITSNLLQSLWTKKEEYFLLKNIEMFGDDWGKVSEALNKTSDQCIFHFLKMSLLDECASFPSICFSSVPNPVSTLIAYISFMIHPSISTELAKTAIKYMDRPHLMEILINVAVQKAREILELEKSKKARIEKVAIEALIRKIGLKIDAVREMFAEVNMVKVELEVAREKLAEELSKSSK